MYQLCLYAHTHHRGLFLPAADLVWSSGIFIYARLLGRLAWVTNQASLLEKRRRTNCGKNASDRRRTRRGFWSRSTKRNLNYAAPPLANV